jgi:hypothetical protein
VPVALGEGFFVVETLLTSAASSVEAKGRIVHW